METFGFYLRIKNYVKVWEKNIFKISAENDLFSPFSGKSFNWRQQAGSGKRESLKACAWLSLKLSAYFDL